MRFYQSLAAALAWSILFFFCVAAVAQPQLPPPGNYTLNGTISIYSAGIQLDPCKATGNLDVNNGTDGTLNNFALDGGGYCNDISETNAPLTLTRTNNTITLQSLNISTSIGDCSGDLDGSLAVSGGVTQIVYTQANSTLSGGLFGLGCAIEGHLDF